jgi:hypothetical protein
MLEHRDFESVKVERTPVSSTQLTSIGYDDASSTLEVEFRKGGVYRYFGVSAQTYRQLIAAQSIGTYFNDVIRDSGLRYRQVS